MLEVLQLCPFLPLLEQGLQERFRVHRWFALDQKERWLDAHAHAVRALVTGGHLGVDNALLARLPALGLIAINGVGFDRVDLKFARDRAIRVTNTPDVLTDDNADLALGLIICLLRSLPAADRYVKEGHWPSGNMPLGRKVSGRRFGIVGLGRIGSAIAARLEILGPVAYCSRTQKPLHYRYFPDPIGLAQESDVLVLAAAANPSTHHLIGRRALDALGPEGFLINIARGSLIDEDELIAALREQRIGGAALDVYAHEPHVSAELRALSNVVLTPHIGSATRETREAMARMVLANLDAFAAQAPLPNALT